MQYTVASIKRSDIIKDSRIDIRTENHLKIKGLI
jgi:hypothetical protein